MIPILSDLIGPIINKVLDYIPDPKAKAEAAAKAEQALLDNQEHIMAMLSASDQKQTETNTEEAKSTSLFIAGWRPFIGWTCGAAFGWAYVVQPIAAFAFSAAHHPVTLPVIEFSAMSQVLMGMLGLGALRTYEKKTGTEGNR
jgi:hypothetical protein